MNHLKNNYIIGGVMVFSAILGILIGLILIKFVKHGVAILGGLAGFVLAIMIVNML